MTTLAILLFLFMAIPTSQDVVTTADPNLEEFTGDLDEMLKKRTIRVLVTYQSDQFFSGSGNTPWLRI